MSIEIDHETKPTAHDVARYILRKAGPMPFVKLQILVYYASAWSYLHEGHPLFDEPIYAFPWGPGVKSIAPDWLRRERVRMRREPRRQAALYRRVRRWAIQEARRKNAGARVGRLNTPGGWSEVDAVAQQRGLIEACGFVRMPALGAV